MTEPWYPGGSDPMAGSPRYHTVPVYDDVFLDLGPLRRKVWAEYRDRSLADWERSGLRFEVRGTTDYLWNDDFTDGQNHDLEILAQLEWGSIVLRRHDGNASSAAVGYYVDTYGTIDVNCGVGEFDFDDLMPSIKAGGTEYLQGAITHELGHTLGFGHGGMGVMNFKYVPGASYTVSDEEIAAVRAYYFGGA